MVSHKAFLWSYEGFSFGVVGEFQNTLIPLWVLKIPFFKKLKNVNAE